MSENDIEDESEKEHETLNLPSLPSRPWYRRKRVWIIGVLALLVYQYIHYHFYRPIEVTYGPWQVLDPGNPVDKPLKFEVVQEGDGPVVEPGDLVQLTLQWRSAQRREYDFTRDWWIWIGFRTEDETPFYAMNPRLLSALVGQKEGGRVRFLESPSKDESAGTVYINPFGSYDYYARKKSGYSNSSIPIFIPISSGRMDVYIKKVFKGQLKYRTVHLHDDTWYLRCSWWRGETGGDGCKFIKASPREVWVDEARYDGVSADGKRATFQYGPVGSGWDWWTRDEWEKLPKGVQVE
jgi:hypothetical protein